MQETKNYDVIILGTGPAGLQAAIHAARKKVSVLVLGKETKSSVFHAHVENFCCIFNITGEEMLNVGRQQAANFGADLLDEDVLSILPDGQQFKIVSESGTELTCQALIVATGTARNKLGVPGEKSFLGKGVSYCVECDANFFKGEDVAVVGGGVASGAAVVGAAVVGAIVVAGGAVVSAPASAPPGEAMVVVLVSTASVEGVVSGIVVAASVVVVGAAVVVVDTWFRSRRKWLLPAPLPPSTATRSPYQSSTSNGSVSPSKARRKAAMERSSRSSTGVRAATEERTWRWTSTGNSPITPAYQVVRTDRTESHACDFFTISP